MAKVTFDNSNNSFFQDLKRSVDAYFREAGLRKTGNWKLYSKTIILVSAALGGYLFLLLGTYTAAIGLLVCAAMGCIFSSIGFNVMHDANHGAYSSRKWVNHLMGLTLNALGANAHFWKHKHNILHHTYTNIAGLDDDIAQTKLLRQSPSQEWLPVHRYQHLYHPLAYSLALVTWVLWGDFNKYFRKRFHHNIQQRMDRSEHLVFWASKLLYFFFYIGLPVYLLGFGPWLAGYATMSLTAGIVLTYTFQLAHAVEGPEFEAAGVEDRMLETEWAVHQIRTTANFAPRNKAVSWFVGGLNFQVEHHLFPRIAHVHYPALSRIVQQCCERHGLPYHCYPTVGAALASHIRTMKELGKKPAEAGTAQVQAA